MKGKIWVFCFSFVLTFALLSECLFATTNKGYYDWEDENNDSIANADAITSERVIQGQFTSTSDNYDYYKIYINSGNSVYAQLSSIPGGCDYDLYLCNASDTTLASSLNSSDVGEWLNYNVTSSAWYYFKVRRYSGTSTTRYRLYVQTTGQVFNQSFYVCNVNSDSWMECLGRDHTNNIGGLVFLSFGEAEKRSGSYYINDLNGNYANMTRVKTAVEKFIQGYNENPKHTNNIQVVVSINNSPSGTAYQLSGTTGEYSAHGAAFKNMVLSISLPSPSKVTAIYGGIDAEMNYNTPTLTRAWVDGYSTTGTTKYLYNFGDHAGRTDDFSGEADPTFDNGWKASDIHYISYGNACSYCVPEIYSQGNANQWAYQKKWSYINYSGLLSTNGWGYISNQSSYSYFYNKLQTEGIGQTLTNKSWIALSPPAQPN